MVKGRNWAFVVYPESLPKNWEEIVTETGLPMAFSPLHDMDINPTGETKKPHYHVICYYENPTTQKSVKEFVTDKLNGTIPIKLESMTGMYRYHIHLDNPEKYQYNDNDRMFFNGFDVHKVESLTYTEIQKLILDIYDFIRKNSLFEYSDLIDVLKDNQLFQLLEVVGNHTILFNTYLTSRRHALKKVLTKPKKGGSLKSEDVTSYN